MNNCRHLLKPQSELCEELSTLALDLFSPAKKAGLAKLEASGILDRILAETQPPRKVHVPAIEEFQDKLK